MESTPTVKYNELTIAEQTIVANATGWDGKEYFDAKSGIRIALVGNGDVAEYRVLEKGDQTQIEAQPVVDAEPVVTAPTETAPVAPTENATVPSTPDTSETQTTTEPTAPTEPVVPVAPTDVPPATDTAPQA